MDQLLVCGVLVAPAEVIFDRSREQDVLLENDGHRVTERLEIIFSHIASADFDRTFRDVIETRDQLDQGSLGGTGSSDDPDRSAGRDLKIDVRERIFLVLSGIAEGNMIKLDAAVLHFLRSVFRRSQDTLMCQDLRDTVAGFLRHAAHNKYHGQHHH